MTDSRLSDINLNLNDYDPDSDSGSSGSDSNINVSRTISNLMIYPIKGCRGIEVTEVNMNESGFQYDRCYALFEDEGWLSKQRIDSDETQNDDTESDKRVLPKFVNTREWSCINQICCDLPSKGSYSGITIRIPKAITQEISDKQNADYSDHFVPLNLNEKNLKTVTVWDSTCEVYDQGDLIANELSEYIMKFHSQSQSQNLDKDLIPKVRLCYFKSRDRNMKEERKCGIVTDQVKLVRQLQDGFPILITTQSTLVDLQEKLNISNYDEALRRFRPNIVVKETDSNSESDFSSAGLSLLRPFEEDFYQYIVKSESESNKNLDFKMICVKPCARCVVPHVNPQNGKRDMNKLTRNLREIAKRDANQMEKKYRGSDSLSSMTSKGNKGSVKGCNLSNSNTTATAILGESLLESESDSTVAKSQNATFKSMIYNYSVYCYGRIKLYTSNMLNMRVYPSTILWMIRMIQNNSLLNAQFKLLFNSKFTVSNSSSTVTKDSTFNFIFRNMPDRFLALKSYRWFQKAVKKGDCNDVYVGNNCVVKITNNLKDKLALGKGTGRGDSELTQSLDSSDSCYVKLKVGDIVKVRMH